VKKKFWNDWTFVLIACVLLGFAPFFPEPHIIGKLRWVAGGGIGMTTMDWFDLLWHGLPFLLLIRLMIVSARRRA
jgi:hypothetical protein